MNNQLGEESDYRIAFFPETYIRGMTLALTLPEQIKLADPSNSIECTSLSNNVADSIECSFEP